VSMRKASVGMSDTEEPKDKKKSLSLSGGTRLELKKTVSSGQVRQSFSHGRSKAVTVEVRKKRTINRDAAPVKEEAVAQPVAKAPEADNEAPTVKPRDLEPPKPAAPEPVAEEVVEAAAPEPVAEEPVAEAPAKAAPAAEAEQEAPAPAAEVEAPAAPQPRVAKSAAEGRAAKPARQPRKDGKSGRGRVVLKSLTDDEKRARLKALEGAKNADDEARRRSDVLARRRIDEDDRRALEKQEAEARVRDEADRKAAEADARKRAEEAAAKRLDDKPAADAQPGPAGPGGPAGPAPRRVSEDEPARAKPKRSRGGRNDTNRRRGGKLTISDALSDRDPRTRSLAAVKRARERERRAMEQEERVKILRDVVIPETISVQELASRMAERGVDVIKTMMGMGVMATINDTLDADTAELVVAEFGHRVKRVADSDADVDHTEEVDDDGDMLPRAPVVTIMGHVDHGKTSLLDALRSTDVAEGEAGGITQHIGAYQVHLPSGNAITFLDTPGHEAFSAMRARGAEATDIVVLVVAADDGIMPQTVEAIRHAKAAKVPIIVAINKMDKPGANPERVRNELLSHEILLESVGGDVLSVEVSAKERTGLDKLEEAILLQSEVLELRANPERAASGVVVEAKIDRGRGPVATVLVQRGTLSVGDIFVAGNESGRVRALIDDHGNKIKTAGPSVPVEVLGLNGAPEAGEPFSVVESEAKAREVAEFRTRRTRAQSATASPRSTLEQMFSQIQEGKASEFPVVIKADVQGSLEAITGALTKLETDEVAIRILHGAVGGINESDISLAQASNALIIAFNVRANNQARDLARRENTEIRYYSVIYDVTDDMKDILSGMLEPTRQENFIGNAQVKEVFGVSKIGKVAGCLITDGMVKKGAGVRLLRDDVVVHEGTLSTLRRFKDDVSEVRAGTECGMSFENYDDIKVGDVIEAFEVEIVARQL
jgi:translation initiation factor IF-2